MEINPDTPGVLDPGDVHRRGSGIQRRPRPDHRRRPDDDAVEQAFRDIYGEDE